MHVTGDLNFSGPVVPVVVSLLALVGFGVIRRKWRLAFARKEEIRRLVVLASVETARAELEATLAVPYSAVTVPKKTYQCVVCFSPTTTRCARCKAVRYCSGICQILHWRKGHKEECRPLNPADHSNNDGSGTARKIAKHKQYEKFEDRFERPPMETSSKESMLSNFGLYPGAAPIKDDIDKVESDAETSESSASMFSGFTTPKTGGESSDNVSVGESIYSSDTEGSDIHIPADIAPDKHVFRLSRMDLTKPSSPRFACLVDSVDNVHKLNKEDQSKPCQCRSSRSPDHSNRTGYNDPIPKTGKTSSDFWGRTLHSNVSSSNIQSDPSLLNSGGDVDRKLSNSESFPKFKFNLSGSGSAPSDDCTSEVSDAMLDDASPSSVLISNSVNGLALSKKTSLDAPKIWSSGFMRFEKSNYVNFNDSNVLNTSELKGKRSNALNLKIQTPDTGGDMLGSSSSKPCPSTSSSIERSNIVCHDSVTTAHVAEFKSSSTASHTCLASSVTENSVSVRNSGKAEIVGADAVKSHQIASFPTNSGNGLKSSMLKVVDQIRGPNCGRYSDKGLFPYDFFVKLYTSNKGERRPCGLINCGNSCFANSVLQCLVFTPPLTAYFAQGLHSKACVHKEWCFTCEFENLILKGKEGKSPLSPSGIISQLQNMGSHLGHGREEDAHEFLRHAIDAMQSVCLKEAGISAWGSSVEETTLIGLTFGGYLRSKIRCMKCHYKSERQERMMDLTVEIEGDVARLEDALRRFTATEILDGDNKYECSRCKSYEKAKKKLTILEAPNVLTIALKRFQSGKFGKLNKSIQFPEVLDLAPYMSGTSDKAPIYRLYGVVVHLDIMNASFSGHYVCYVKNIQNKWFKIDDSTVTAVELERVLTKGAYMLLYARCSPRAPRLMRNRIVSLDPKNKDKSSEVDPKNSSLRSASTRATIAQSHTISNPHDTVIAESFYPKFLNLQKILEEDSSSDDYSFTSSNSEEGSCSTDSTRDSTSTDDLSDFIFGGWGSSWRNTSDSDSSSSPSSSPLNRRPSTLSYSDPHASRPLDSISSQIDRADPAMQDADLGKMRNGRNKSAALDGKEGDHFLQRDTSKRCRKSVGSHSCRGR